MGLQGERYRVTVTGAYAEAMPALDLVPVMAPPLVTIEDYPQLRQLV